MNTSTSGLQPVNTFGIVKLTPPQLAMAQPMSTSRRTGYWNSPSFSSVQVTLKEQYFVNAIELEGLPNQPVNPIGLVTHNEVPMVSKNTQEYHCLYSEYSNYICMLHDLSTCIGVSAS